MLERIRPYGFEESIDADTVLYSLGDRNLDLSIVLEGGIDIVLPDGRGETKVYNQIRVLNFTGELNLFTSQGAVVEARTIAPSRLLRIPRTKLRDLMQSEGDIANLLIQACVWRRLRLVEAELSGVTLEGGSEDPQMMLLRRFLLRNMFPHRIVELPPDYTPSPEGTGVAYPIVQLPDGRILERPRIAELADELGIAELPD